MLSISFNSLELPSDWTKRDTLRSFNDQGETIPFKKDNLEYFPKLERIILIETNMTFKKLNLLIDYFPKVTELVLPNNKCNDFEEIQIEKYQNIDSLNLESNDIDTEKHELDILTKFGKLQKLCIIKNNIKRILCAEKFENLTHLNISENNISDGIIFRDIRKMPKLESIRSMRNILNEVHTYRHLRQWVIAELPNIDTYNGGKLKKLERKDSELYIMRWGFHEYFREAKENHMSYKFENFKAWATENFPVSLDLIEKYENPYPEMTEEDAEMAKEQMQDIGVKTPTAEIIKLYFTAMVGPQMGRAPLVHKFPISTDFYYIRTWVINMFKIKKTSSVKLSFRKNPDEIFEEVEEFGRTIQDYGLDMNSEILVNGEE